MALKFLHKYSLLGSVTVLLWFFMATDLIAQNGGVAGASTRIGYSARGMGMSNAMSAVTSEGAFSYYNPAQAALLLESRQTDLTVGALKFGRVFQSSGIQFQLPPSAGFSINILRSGINDIDGRTQSGYPTEKFDASEYQIAGNFGIRLNEKLNAGIGLKFSIANYHPQLDNSTNFGIDLGLLYSAGSNFNIAVSAKDLFSSYSWNSQNLYSLSQSRNEVNDFPTRIIMGLAYQRKKLTLSSDFELQLHSTEVKSRDQGTNGISSYDKINTNSSQLRFGGSWDAHERFTIRVGWQLPEISTFKSWSAASGFSIHLPFDVFSPSIDYAFVLEPYRISNMHVFSLRLNL